MGWTEFQATHFTASGKIDKKAVMDNCIEECGDCQVVRSSIVKGVYYGAIRNVKKDYVFGLVCLIRVSERYESFAYKDMSESELPYYFNCPKSIIKLLSPTTDKDSLEWRQKCLEPKQKTVMQRLNELKIGTKIKINYNNRDMILFKSEPRGRFKKPIWMVSEFSYLPANRIPDNFVVVE